MFKIHGVLHHNAWGDLRAIAEVRGVDPSGRPEAEYWLGAHPRGPSQILSTRSAPTNDAESQLLDDFIAADKAAVLGPETTARFEELPFLLKLLAAAQPLSIQAHPNQDQAVAGFEREERLGIDLKAPNRSYRDRNHKPELVCALTRFEGKCGFRDVAETRRLLALFTDPRVQPLHNLLDLDEADEADVQDEGSVASTSSAMAESVRWLLSADRAAVADLVQGLVENCKQLLSELETTSNGRAREFEAELRWTVAMDASFPGDPGVAVALLLNHVVLEPGEALFLEAGVLHCYLRGLAVELMANSDNVLRGGLTVKHIDVAELLSVARYEPYAPRVQRPTADVHHYRIPVGEFGLTRYITPSSPSPGSNNGEGSASMSRLDQRHDCAVRGPEMVLATAGRVELVRQNETLELGAGEAAFVPHDGGAYSLSLLEPATMAWRVGIGD